MRLEYELAYYDSAVHRFNHYTTRTPPVNMCVSAYMYTFVCPPTSLRVWCVSIWAWVFVCVCISSYLRSLFFPHFKRSYTFMGILLSVYIWHRFFLIWFTVFLWQFQDVCPFSLLGFQVYTFIIKSHLKPTFSFIFFFSRSLMSLSAVISIFEASVI